MKKLNAEEIRIKQLDLLLNFDEYCRNNGLRYILCGGTLLGAVRHQGFIPWDDDIDVMMPRTDYEKLLETEKEWDTRNHTLLVSWRTGQLYYPFLKLIDTDTVVHEEYLVEDVTTGIWIDIFPCDGMPDDDKKILQKFRKIQFWKFVLMASLSDRNKGANSWARIIKRIVTPVMKHFDKQKICERMNTLSMEYPFESAPFQGVFVWGYGPQEKMPRSLWKTVLLSFEGHQLPAPSCWDQYLTALYGDYMTLPPVEKRIRHDFEAWARDE